MKVILINAVKNIGLKNQVVEVSDGYAKNYLFPRKLAIAATADALKVNEQILADKMKEEQSKVIYFQEIKIKLARSKIDFKLKKHGDKVASSISAKQLCNYIQENFAIVLDKHKFINFKPINKIGTTEVSVKLYSDIVAKFNVNVNAI